MHCNGSTTPPGSVELPSAYEAVLKSAACEALKELGAGGVTIFLKAPGAERLDAAVVAVTPLGVATPESMMVHDPVYASARAFRSGQPATADSRDIVTIHPDLSSFAPFPYFVGAVPLRCGGRVVGAFSATWQRTSSEVRPEFIEVMTGRAARLTADIELTARGDGELCPPSLPVVIPCPESGSGGDEIAATAALVYHLHKLAVLLAPESNTQRIIGLGMQRIISGFRAKAAAIALVEGGRFHAVDAVGCSADFLRDLDGTYVASGSPEAEVVTSGQLAVCDVDDRRTRERIYPTEPGDVVWIIIPLLSGQRAIGVCSIAFASGRADVISHQGLLTTLGIVMGKALENSLMHGAQHALAEKLQQALLPGVLPQASGIASTSRYAPATSGIDIGGDWYDVISLPDGNLGMVVGDVAGHNTEAAVVMGQLRSAVRAYATNAEHPARVLDLTNSLLADLDTDLFATCCCVWLDPDTGFAQIATAGHPLPLIRGPDGSHTALTPEVGPPLGVLPGHRFGVTTLRLEPGTLLALYTDGMVQPGNEMGPQVLDQAVELSGGELEALGDQLTSRFDEPRIRHCDDAALLLVMYEGPSADARRNVRQFDIQRRDLQGAHRARELLIDWLQEWELAQVADEAALLLSETVTNGLVHGDSDVYVCVRRYPTRLRVEVRDSDPHLAVTAVAPRAEDQAEGGRGLIIVSALASAWGNSPGGRGKTVWFELATTAQPLSLTESAAG